MKTLVDDRLREQARRFAFRFACDDCVHFGGGACSLAYPASPRRSALEEAEAQGEPTVSFCKSFELV
jgi:hypothetical protein